MKNFIHLTSRVINKLHIIEIIKNPNKYEIYMSNYNVDGFLWFGSGSLYTKPNIIEICNTKDKQDYETITHFIQVKDQISS